MFKMFKLYDIVGRTLCSDDAHLVTKVSEDLIEVVCIKEDSRGVYKLGEMEGNLPRRYVKLKGKELKKLGLRR